MRIIDRAQQRLHRVLQSPKGNSILKSASEKFNGNLELGMGSLLWHARCECLKTVLAADTRFKKFGKKDLTNFLVAEIIQCTKPLAKKKKLNAQVITRSEARKLVGRCEVLGGPGLSFQRIYVACTQRNARTSKPKSQKLKPKTTPIKSPRSSTKKPSGAEPKANIADVVESAATSYLRHFGDKTSMQHLKAQLIAEFGESVYRAHEKSVLKLLADAIQSWSSAKLIERDSVAFAFLSCVDMQRCLEWASRLHGLRERLIPFMHKERDTVSSKFRGSGSSAQLLANCVLRSIEAARRQQEVKQSAELSYRPFPLADHARVADTDMTEESAEQLLRQTLADTLASVRAGNNPEHAVPSNAEVGGDGQGDKIHSEGDDTSDPKPLHPNHEIAADVNLDCGPNLHANGGTNLREGTNDDVESRTATHGITQSLVDARTNADVAESIDAEALTLPAVETQPETESDAVRATITTESTAQVGNDDTDQTEKHKTLHHEAKGGVSDLGTQSDSRLDADPELDPDPRRTLFPNPTTDSGSDAIFDRKSKPDPEPEMECFPDFGTNSKANHNSNSSAPGISMSTAETDINETAEAEINDTTESNSGPKADKIEDTNPATDTELIPNANVDSADTNADRKPTSTSHPNTSDVLCNTSINTSTEVASSSATGSRQNPNAGKRRGSAARNKTPRKAAKPATKAKTIRKLRPKKNQNKERKKKLAVRVGVRVRINHGPSSGLEGTVKFVGQTTFSKGKWIGIELAENMGKNDGSVNGVQYFSCKPGYGVFVLWGTCSPSQPKPKFKTQRKKKKVVRKPKGTGKPPTSLPAVIKVVSSVASAAQKAKKAKKKRKPLARRRFVEGEIVQTDRDGATVTGIVKFFGSTEFAPGVWVGIELPKPLGLNNGSVLGRQYFECSPKHGLFVPVNKVVKAQS